MPAALAGHSPLPSLVDVGGRLLPYRPPFAFTDFFSPEDTLLCLLAAESASRGPRSTGPERIVELTAGSALVGISRLLDAPDATLTGVDADPRSPIIASANARRLGVANRSHFLVGDLWDAGLGKRLGRPPIDLLICNPPYIPEPPNRPGKPEAGAGPDGAAHLNRMVELVSELRPATLALSWCSLSDPEGVLGRYEELGYDLDTLFIAMIADGEYSGSVHGYLRTLPTAYLAEDPISLATVAPDGSARFAYLLFAGSFRLRSGRHRVPPAAASLGALCRDFSRRGGDALRGDEWPDMAGRSCVWVLDRWGELALRVLLHGTTDR
jgi:hypothetical protein